MKLPKLTDNLGEYFRGLPQASRTKLLELGFIIGSLLIGLVITSARAGYFGDFFNIRPSASATCDSLASQDVCTSVPGCLWSQGATTSVNCATTYTAANCPDQCTHVLPQTKSCSDFNNSSNLELVCNDTPGCSLKTTTTTKTTCGNVTKNLNCNTIKKSTDCTPGKTNGTCNWAIEPAHCSCSSQFKTQTACEANDCSWVAAKPASCTGGTYQTTTYECSDSPKNITTCEGNYLAGGSCTGTYFSGGTGYCYGQANTPPASSSASCKITAEPSTILAGTSSKITATCDTSTNVIQKISVTIDGVLSKECTFDGKSHASCELTITPDHGGDTYVASSFVDVAQGSYGCAGGGCGPDNLANLVVLENPFLGQNPSISYSFAPANPCLITPPQTTCPVTVSWLVSNATNAYASINGGSLESITIPKGSKTITVGPLWTENTAMFNIHANVIESSPGKPAVTTGQKQESVHLYGQYPSITVNSGSFTAPEGTTCDILTGTTCKLPVTWKNITGTDTLNLVEVTTSNGPVVTSVKGPNGSKDIIVGSSGKTVSLYATDYSINPAEADNNKHIGTFELKGIYPNQPAGTLKITSKTCNNFSCNFTVEWTAKNVAGEIKLDGKNVTNANKTGKVTFNNISQTKTIELVGYINPSDPKGFTLATLELTTTAVPAPTTTTLPGGKTTVSGSLTATQGDCNFTEGSASCNHTLHWKPSALNPQNIELYLDSDYDIETKGIKLDSSKSWDGTFTIPYGDQATFSVLASQGDDLVTVSSVTVGSTTQPIVSQPLPGGKTTISGSLNALSTGCNDTTCDYTIYWAPSNFNPAGVTLTLTGASQVNDIHPKSDLPGNWTRTLPRYEETTISIVKEMSNGESAIIDSVTVGSVGAPTPAPDAAVADDGAGVPFVPTVPTTPAEFVRQIPIYLLNFIYNLFN